MAALDFPSIPAVGQIFTPGAGLPTYVFDGTAWVVITPGPQNPQRAGFRNILINGGPSIGQRTTTGAGQTACFTVDRWRWDSVGTTANPSLPNFTLGQPDVPGEPGFFQRLVVASVAGAGNYGLFHQKIEFVRSLASNEPYTLSLYAKADAARPIALEIQRNYGTGGSPSAAENSLVRNRFSLSTLWQPFSFTFVMPSLAGKTIGTGNNDYVWLIFWLDCGANFSGQASGIGQQSGTFDFANIQLEHGPLATPFERRPQMQELRLCQRYYETAWQYQSFPNYPTGGGAWNFVSPFRATKRGAPTQTYQSLSPSHIAGQSLFGPSGYGDCLISQVVGDSVFTNVSQQLVWTCDAEL